MNTCKRKLGDGLTASVTRKKNRFEYAVWDEFGERIGGGIYTYGDRFITMDDVFDQLDYEYVTKAHMECLAMAG